MGGANLDITISLQYVGVEKQLVGDGEDEKRGQTKDHRRLKQSSSACVFERADGVERNVGRVFTVALVQMYC